MDDPAQAWLEETAIVCIADKSIAQVDLIKTIDDPLFGCLQLGKFTYLGEVEINYTYIKKVDPSKEVSAEWLWRLLGSSQKHPEKGYTPKLLAYSSTTSQQKARFDRVDL